MEFRGFEGEPHHIWRPRCDAQSIPRKSGPCCAIKTPGMIAIGRRISASQLAEAVAANLAYRDELMVSVEARKKKKRQTCG